MEAIPGGFYLVADSENWQLEFQEAVIGNVCNITHVAPADDNVNILDDLPAV
jgi:hypothetical protein